MARIIREVALYCNDGIHRKDAIWAACYSENAYLVVWGARNTKYQDRGSKLNISASAARSEFESKLAEKLAKGYFEVQFAHASYGNIPSFAAKIGDKTSYVITPADFAGEIDRLAAQLQGAFKLDERAKIRQVQLRLTGQLLRLETNDTAMTKLLDEQTRRLDNLLTVQVGTARRLDLDF